MNIVFENEVEVAFDFDAESVANEVVLGCLDYIKCPYEVTVEVTLTNNDEIHRINQEFRQIDRPTDVLSFPMVEYEEAGNFDFLEDDMVAAEYFDCETGELILGDIIISVDKVFSQAEEYGHTPKREFAFLVAHSMFHLFGFDHMEEEEREEMERMQREVLESLHILR